MKLAQTVLQSREKKTEERDGSVDLLRAFGILWMVMGHAGFGERFDYWIHAFHMPLWFVVSGYFLNENTDLFKHIKKRVRSLMIPYVVFGIGYIGLQGVYYGKGWCWSGLLWPNTVRIPLNGALWFLPALFIADILAFVIIKYLPKSISYKVLAVIACLGCLHLYELPLSADSALVGAGFILIGRLIREREDELLNIKLWLSIVIAAVVTHLIFVNGYVNIRTNEYSDISLFWINSGIMILALWNICKWIDKKLDLQHIKEVGKESMIYVCCNQYLLFWINDNIAIACNTRTQLYMWNGAKTIIVIIVCFVVNMVVKKTPLRYLLGIYK